MCFNWLWLKHFFFFYVKIKKISNLFVIYSEVRIVDLEKEVERYKNGCEKAFDHLYKETVSLARFAIYQRIPNQKIIEDLLQDVYMKVSTSISNYSAKSFRAWIYTLAKNTALDYLKKKKEILCEEQILYFGIQETHPYLYYAIRHLEEIEREVFLMKVLCGHTTRRISEILNIQPSLVNHYYYQAKEKLKQSLEEFQR